MGADIPRQTKALTPPSLLLEREEAGPSTRAGRPEQHGHLRGSWKRQSVYLPFLSVYNEFLLA